MGRRSKYLIERERLLAMIPKGAVRVQVIDEKGQTRYKNLLDLADKDEIQVTKKGDPIVTMAKSGRRLNDGRVELEPINDTVAEVLKQKQASMGSDPILETAQKAPESTDLLHYVMVAMAEEASSIGFERGEAERQGLETSNISTRRINALTKLVETWLKRKDQITVKDIDLKAPATRALFQYVFEMFKDSMETSGIGPEMTETIFAKVAKLLDSEQWANEAKNRMKSAV